MPINPINAMKPQFYIEKAIESVKFLLWLGALPICVSIDFCLLPLVLLLHDSFTIIGRRSFITATIENCKDSFVDPLGALNSLKVLFDSVVDAIIDCLPDKLKKSLQAARKKTPSPSVNNLKPPKKYRKGQTNGEFLKKLWDMLVNLLNEIFSVLWGLLAYLELIPKCIFLVLVVLVITVFNIVVCIILYLFEVLKSILCLIPGVQGLFNSVPFSTLIDIDLAANLWNQLLLGGNIVFYPNTAIQKANSSKLDRLYTAIITAIKVYVYVCFTVLSMGTGIILRAVLEIARYFCDTSSYTLFSMGLVVFLSILAIVYSSSLVDPLDYSMKAYTGAFLSNYTGSTKTFEDVFFVVAAIFTLYYLYALLTNRKNAQNKLKSSTKEKEEFKFVILNLLIAGVVLTGCASIMNIFIGGPNNVLETVPISLLYIMAIEILYDIKNIYYGAITEEIGQHKSMLLFMLLVLCRKTHSIGNSYLSYAFLGASLFTALFSFSFGESQNAELVKDEDTLKHKRAIYVRQIVYILIRIAIIGAIAAFISPHIPTVVFRPFLYVKDFIFGIRALLILEARVLILGKSAINSGTHLNSAAFVQQ